MGEKGNHDIDKLSCDVVKDLVPSYLENICSESSERAVEAHLAECADCCGYVQNMRQTMIEGAQANLKEVDYMKKLRRYYDKKVIVHLIGILLAVMAVFWCIKDCWDMELAVYEIALPVITLVLMFLLQDGQEYREKRIARRVSAGLALLGLGYVIGLTGSLIALTYMEEAPFGIPMYKMGPFLHRQIMAVIILETVLLAWSLRDAMQKDCRLGFTSAAALAGMAFGMALNEQLYPLDTFDALRAVCWQMFVVFGLEAIVLGGVTAVFSRPIQGNGADSRECS